MHGQIFIEKVIGLLQLRVQSSVVWNDLNVFLDNTAKFPIVQHRQKPFTNDVTVQRLTDQNSGMFFTIRTIIQQIVGMNRLRTFAN